MCVSISKGNTKMGEIKSVSLPPSRTCGNCICREKCYAQKMLMYRRNVRRLYENNYRILSEEPETYWREVEAAIMISRFFRFHVAGEIPNGRYFRKMVEVADRNAHCSILCFTKRYDIVNKFIDQYGIEGIPANLHVVFSGWPGLPMSNPYDLPEAHIRLKSGITTASSKAIPCSGNCTKCVQADGGCWNMKRGEQVVFKEH